jgi:alpha-1,6-mannosyltransferase
VKLADVAEFYAELGGGVRTYIDQKLRAAAEAGHQALVVAPGPEDREQQRAGGRIIWIRSRPLPVDRRYYLLLDEAKVRRVLDREAPDVVEGSSPWTGGWFAARWPGRALKAFVFHQDPVAVYPHTLLGRFMAPGRIDGLFGWYWGYLRRLSSGFDLTVAGGAWLAERLTRFGIHRPTAVPFGIDKKQFSPDLRSEQVREELLERCGVGGQGKLLVTVSRHHPEKHLGTLLAAFAAASKRRPLGLVIYGDGPLRRWVEHRAAGIPGVNVAGFVSDRQALARALASADALLHGSAAETYGLSVAEAICSGLPLVAPDCGGAADLAGPGYAEQYPAGDAIACADAILRLLDRDPDVMRKQCRLAAETRVLSVEEHFRLLFDCYEQRLAR